MTLSRCGCNSDCSCVIVGGTDCVEVTGTGTPGTPYRVSVVVDPEISNQLGCAEGGNGLYVPPPAVFVSSSTNIAMDGTGTPGDPLYADIIIDDDPCNLSHTAPDPSDGNGLLTVLRKANGYGVQLGGCGTLADPLIADLILDPSLDNMSHNAPTLDDGAGLYTVLRTANGPGVELSGAGVLDNPLTATAVFDIYGSLGRHAAYSSPTGTGTVVIAPFPWDIAGYNQGGIVDLPTSSFIIPVNGAGWYHIKAHWEELAASDSFEADGKFYQISGRIVATGRTVAAVKIELMSALVQAYSCENIVYLNDGDTVHTAWAVRESTNLLPLAARSFDVTHFVDSSHPCAFEIQRIARKVTGGM